MRVLVDSNIIIDVLEQRPNFVKESKEALENVLVNHKGYISASSMTDIFYILRKKLGTFQARKKLEEITEILEVADTRAEDITQALSCDIKDFEDAVIAMVAKRIRCKYILTRNGKDFKNSEVKAISPIDFVKK